MKILLGKAAMVVFSVSPSVLERVKRYIENQKEHHKKVSFKDEYRQFLNEHGMPYDEDHLWT